MLPTFPRAVALMLLVLTVSCARGAAAQDSPTPSAETRTYELPGDNVFPQGVAYDPAAGAFFVGNTEDGTILRGDLETGEIAVFAPGGDAGTAVNGLAMAPNGLLYVAGRASGEVLVYDTASGELLRLLGNGQAADTSALSDVVVAPDGSAYVTAASTPVLYRIAPAAQAEAATPPPAGGTPAVETGELEVFLDFTGTALAYRAGTGAEGVNADGIVATPDGAYLLIVQSNTGGLFRVEIATREVVAVDLGGTALKNGDGLALDGRTLHVVLKRADAVVPVAMADDFASGQVGDPITDPSLDFPTDIALVGDGTALVANHQIPEERQPGTVFTVSRLPLPEAGAVTSR